MILFEDLDCSSVWDFGIFCDLDTNGCGGGEADALRTYKRLNHARLLAILQYEELVTIWCVHCGIYAGEDVSMACV